VDASQLSIHHLGIFHPSFWDTLWSIYLWKSPSETL